MLWNILDLEDKTNQNFHAIYTLNGLVHIVLNTAPEPSVSALRIEFRRRCFINRVAEPRVG